MRYTETFAFAAALCLLSACSSGSPTAPGDPRMDESGYTMGSGTRTNTTTAEGSLPTGNVTPSAQASGASAPDPAPTPPASTTTSSPTPGGDGAGGGDSEESPYTMGSGT